MIQEQVYKIINEYSYVQLYGLVFGYFILLYFALAPLFLMVCKTLNRKNLLQRITDDVPKKNQINFEIKHSVLSIFIFGFSGIPVIHLIRNGIIALLPDTVFNIVTGLVLLTVWNEVHFFIVHRMMHQPFFMKRVHYVHHRSKVPTVYSVYSFHWLEALLLSTVPVTIALVIPLAPLAIFLFPLVSILLNYAGHCNFRFGNGTGANGWLFGTNHNQHHVKGRKNYGFASDLLDRFSQKGIKKNITSKKH